MAMNPKDGKLLYHLTAISNLESILENGLLPREDCEDFKDIADHDIIECREKNSLLKYSPFHFFGGTPFAGAVQIANKNEGFIYIAIERSLAEYNKFKVIPAHPLSIVKLELFEYEEGMDEIDWDLMAKRDYSDNDCKNVCMAECLTELIIPAKLFHTIFTKNEKEKKTVLEICRKKYNGSKIPFQIVVNRYFFKADD